MTRGDRNRNRKIGALREVVRADRGVLADVSEVFEYPAEADALSELLTAA